MNALKEKIESQKGKSDCSCTGTGLDPETGHEQSRTGKRTDNRDIQPGARPETDTTRSQNASGGKTNR